MTGNRTVTQCRVLVSVFPLSKGEMLSVFSFLCVFVSGSASLAVFLPFFSS